MSERPTTSNADEWQLWLIEGPLAGSCGVNAAYLAVQIVEAIEEHQKALAREVYGLREQTEAEYETTAKRDDIMGAFARGRMQEAKTIARAINAIMPYSRDTGALAHGGRQRLAAQEPLRKRPIAWMRYVAGGPQFQHASDEGDPPDDDGWIALYRRGGPV